MKRGIVFLLMAMAAQARAVEIKTFDLTGYFEPAMNPADRTPLLRDARTRLPKLLRACGIRRFQSVPVTDGAVVYRFLASSDAREVTCIRNLLPKGARLDP